MNRIRLSTTVDGSRLEACRRRLGINDSKLIDRALVALVNELERESELAALDVHPYEGDPDLAWAAPAAPALPYHGDVPASVIELAARRHRSP